MGRWDKKEPNVNNTLHKRKRTYNLKLFRWDLDNSRPYERDTKITTADMGRDAERQDFLTNVKNADKYLRKKKPSKPRAKRRPKKQIDW